MSKPRISMIVAIDEERGIGKNNDLLFKIPEDLARFRKITSGCPVIMGYNTYKSLPALLPGRLNIVVVEGALAIPGASVVTSLAEAIKAANMVHTDELFIIGGGMIYAQGIKYADRLYLTLVEGKYDAEVFFPDYSEFARVISDETHESAGYKYRYLTLEK